MSKAEREYQAQCRTTAFVIASASGDVGNIVVLVWSDCGVPTSVECLQSQDQDHSTGTTFNNTSPLDGRTTARCTHNDDCESLSSVASGKEFGQTPVHAKTQPGPLAAAREASPCNLLPVSPLFL